METNMTQTYDEYQLEKHMTNTKRNTLEDNDIAKDIVKINRSDRSKFKLMSRALTDDEQYQVDDLVARLDPTDSLSVMSFGTTAQKRTGEVSSALLNQVKARDLSIISDDLKELVATAEGCSPADAPNWFERIVLRKAAQPLREFLDGFNDVESHIGKVETKLMEHHRDLIDSMENLRDLYEGTLIMYRELHIHIIVLEQCIEKIEAEIDEINLKLQDSSDNGDLAVQIEELGMQRDTLDRQRDALRRTQTLAAQDMTKLAKMKNVDEQIINKITQTMTLTIPLWKSTLAQIVEASKTKDVLDVIGAVNQFTDTLVQDGSTKIAQMHSDAYAKVEAAIVTKEAIRIANEAVKKSTIEHIQLAEEARRVRAIDNIQMIEMQEDIADSIVKARKLALTNEAKRSDARLQLTKERGKDFLDVIEKIVETKDEDAAEKEKGDGISPIPDFSSR